MKKERRKKKSQPRVCKSRPGGAAALIVLDHMPLLSIMHLVSAHPGSRERHISPDLWKGWAESF